MTKVTEPNLKRAVFEICPLRCLKKDFISNIKRFFSRQTFILQLHLKKLLS